MRTSYTFTAEQLSAFKAQWPCHNLPDRMDSLYFEYDANGDLVDFAPLEADGQEIDQEDWPVDAGPAAHALSLDGQTLSAGGTVTWWRV